MSQTFIKLMEKYTDEMRFDKNILQSIPLFITYDLLPQIYKQNLLLYGTDPESLRGNIWYVVFYTLLL